MDTSIAQHPIITMTPVTSSQIHSIGHHPESDTLAVRFPPNRKGVSSVYHYAHFNSETFAAFEKAESKGSFFGKHIKPCADQYPYVNVTSLYDEAAKGKQD